MATATTTKTPAEKTKPGRRVLRKAGRVKRNAKLATDKEFATKFFEAKSTRAVGKKVTFRKKKSPKK
jgi:hypothetical protein